MIGGEKNLALNVRKPMDGAKKTYFQQKCKENLINNVFFFVNVFGIAQCKIIRECKKM